MPEGDVVWRTARRLHTAFVGQELTLTDFRWPSLATVHLAGRSTLEVVSRGKHVLHRLDGTPSSPPLTVHSHLRMEGTWRLHRSLPGGGAGATGQRWGGHDLRAVLRTADWTALGRRLGMLDVLPTDQEERVVGHLGMDVLGHEWDEREAAVRLGAEAGRPVGEVLLDQRVLAGAGTFYLCETCFLLGVTPWTPIGEGPDPVQVARRLHALMSFNRERVPQTTTGDTRTGHNAYVHARTGRPCLRCGTPIRTGPLGQPPAQRVVSYCPRCQRGHPAPG